jgi:hypothetical protein
VNTFRRTPVAEPARNAPRAPRPQDLPPPPPVAARPVRPVKPPKPAKPRKKGPSIFGLLDKLLRVDSFFREGVPVRYLPHVLWTMLLVLLYIANSHFANRTERMMNRVKAETEDLRADYTTLKSEYMQASIQSEVARRVAPVGLVESRSPPFRVVLRGPEADSVIIPDAEGQERLLFTDVRSRR